LDNERYSPCAYIRLLQPLHHPNIAHGLDIQCGHAAAALREMPDVIVTHRHAITDDQTVKALLAHCRQHDIRLVYDLDDDLLDVPPEHPEAERLSQLAGTVAYLAAKADAVWVSTQQLAARVGRPRRKTFVLPNCLDERLWWPPPAVDLPPVGPTRLLYMGTRTHAADLDLILPALNRLGAEFGDRVAIDVIGVSPHRLPAGLNRLDVPYPASQTYPAFVNWLSRQNRWHIGLAPLVDTAFNRGKSAIKAIDYAALGLPCVASDVGVFSGTIENGVNGLLVENTEAAWFSALAGLLRDPHRCQALARAARSGFATRFTLAGQAAIWRNALAAQRA